VDFRSGQTAARYLFFFGYPSFALRGKCDVTLHVAREEPPNSFNYNRLELLTAPNVPDLIEIGYVSHEEAFISRSKQGMVRNHKIEEIGRQFFSEVVKMHFSN
jgi:hypothetical protein